MSQLPSFGAPSLRGAGLVPSATTFRGFPAAEALPPTPTTTTTTNATAAASVGPSAPAAALSTTTITSPLRGGTLTSRQGIVIASDPFARLQQRVEFSESSRERLKERNATLEKQAGEYRHEIRQLKERINEMATNAREMEAENAEFSEHRWEWVMHQQTHECTKITACQAPTPMSTATKRAAPRKKAAPKKKAAAKGVVKRSVTKRARATPMAKAEVVKTLASTRSRRANANY